MSQIVKKQRGKYPLKEYQQIMYDFILGKRSIAQFEINNEQYFLKRGTSHFGFEHIILRHYGQECDGAITARDILNIANIIKNGRVLTDAELQKRGTSGYAQIKNNEKYVVILNKERNGHWIITFFSSK